MKRSYDPSKQENIELLRELALASEEEDGDGIFSESEAGEFEESVQPSLSAEAQPSTSSGVQIESTRSTRLAVTEKSNVFDQKL